MSGSTWVHLRLWRPMDGGTIRNGHPSSFFGPLFPFILSLDVRSRKELAEDWIDDKDGLLVFSGLFSATILVFIAGGNSKMLCGPVAADTLLVAQMSHDLMDMLNLNGTDNDTQPAVLPPSPMSFRPSVSVWINVIWSISLTLSFMCTFFGWCLKRWAFRYYFYNSPRIDSRDPRHHRSQAIEGPDASRPSAIVALLHFFLPLSVFLFYFGLIVFLIHIDVTLGLAFVSLLVISGLLFSRT